MSTPRPISVKAWTWRGDLPDLFARRPELREVFPKVAALSDAFRWNT